MDSKPVVAIAPEVNQKLAALMFDFIIPVGSSTKVPRSIVFTAVPNPKHFATEDMDPVIMKIGQGWIRRLGSKRIPEAVTETIREVKNQIMHDLHAHLLAHGVCNVPLFYSLAPYHDYLPAGDVEAIEFTMCKADIIDTSALSWDQIVEVREDEEFSRKIRAFRAFAACNYGGKDRQYITDDLSRKMDEYRSACKKHGIDLILGTLSHVLDSKSLLGCLGIAAAGVLTGSSAAITAGLAGGTVLEIGKMAIQIAHKRLQFKHFRDNAELAYLVQLDDMAKRSQPSL